MTFQEMLKSNLLVEVETHKVYYVSDLAGMEFNAVYLETLRQADEQLRLRLMACVHKYLVSSQDPIFPLIHAVETDINKESMEVTFSRAVTYYKFVGSPKLL